MSTLETRIEKLIFSVRGLCSCCAGPATLRHSLQAVLDNGIPARRLSAAIARIQPDLFRRGPYSDGAQVTLLEEVLRFLHEPMHWDRLVQAWISQYPHYPREVRRLHMESLASSGAPRRWRNPDFGAWLKEGLNDRLHLIQACAMTMLKEATSDTATGDSRHARELQPLLDAMRFAQRRAYCELETSVYSTGEERHREMAAAVAENSRRTYSELVWHGLELASRNIYSNEPLIACLCTGGLPAPVDEDMATRLVENFSSSPYLIHLLLAMNPEAVRPELLPKAVETAVEFGDEKLALKALRAMANPSHLLTELLHTRHVLWAALSRGMDEFFEECIRLADGETRELLSIFRTEHSAAMDRERRRTAEEESRRNEHRAAEARREQRREEERRAERERMAAARAGSPLATLVQEWEGLSPEHRIVRVANCDLYAPASFPDRWADELLDIEALPGEAVRRVTQRTRRVARGPWRNLAIRARARMEVNYAV